MSKPEPSKCVSCQLVCEFKGRTISPKFGELEKVLKDCPYKIKLQQIIEPYLRYQSELYKRYIKPQVDLQLGIRAYLDNFQAIQKDLINSWRSIYENLSRSFATYYSEQFLKQPIKFIAPPKPHSQELIERLSACPPGLEKWKEFEDICKEILTFLFVPPLLEPLDHVRTESGLQIRDLIFHIPCNVGGFWDFIQRKYDAVAVIVECKNYSNPIEGNNVVISSKYLGKKRLGLFGIVISRFSPAESAFKERKRLWTEDGKLILCLKDKDLKTMIKLKDEGKDSEIILDMKQRDFLQSLE